MCPPPWAPAAANLYNPNPRDPVTGHNPVRSGAFTEGEVNTQSLYVFDTISSATSAVQRGVRSTISTPRMMQLLCTGP